MYMEYLLITLILIVAIMIIVILAKRIASHPFRFYALHVLAKWICRKADGMKPSASCVMSCDP